MSVVERGNGWEMHLGDCIEVMKGMADRSVDHVITDPPYGEHVHSKPWQSKKLGHSAHAGIDFACLTDATRSGVASAMQRLAKRWSIAFCDIEGGEAWRDAMSRAGLDYVRTCVWDKVDSSPQFTGDRPASSAELFCCAHQPGKKRWNGGGRRSVFTFAVNGGEKGSKPHPTTKPDALMFEIVRLFTDAGETVLDPFSGSGSTGVACIVQGRSYVGVERDPKYFSLSCERLRAAQSGLRLKDARAGQTSLLDLVNK